MLIHQKTSILNPEFDSPKNKQKIELDFLIKDRLRIEPLTLRGGVC
jgi:hypothetical protein